jgi:hypothetical protein
MVQNDRATPMLHAVSQSTSCYTSLALTNFVCCWLLSVAAAVSKTAGRPLVAWQIMGRGKSLSEYEKGLIDAYKSADKSNREIALLINRSRSCCEQLRQ